MAPRSNRPTVTCRDGNDLDDYGYLGPKWKPERHTRSEDGALFIVEAFDGTSYVIPKDEIHEFDEVKYKELLLAMCVK